MLLNDSCPFLPFLDVTDSYRMFYAFWLIALSMGGIFGNSLLLLTILVNRAHFLKIDVFLIAISQSLIGVVYFVVHAAASVPVLLDSFTYVTDLSGMIALTTVDTFAYYVDQGCLMAIAINRFFHICTKVDQTTTLQIAKSLHLCTWFFSILIVLIPSLNECFKVFSPRVFAYTLACSKCGVYQKIYMMAGYMIPGSILFIYMVILLWIQFRKKEISVNVSLTLQCFLITVPALLSPMIFFSTSSWFPKNGYVGIIPMTWTGLTMLANPLVYFMFNDSVKRSVRLIFYGKKMSIGVVVESSKSLSGQQKILSAIH